jgi:D-alanyl-D-alanine carboxypeptidase-like protein
MGKAARAIRAPNLASTIFSGASPSPGDVIPIPATSTFNQGLHSADESTMLGLLGVPGQKTSQCSPVTGTIKARIETGVDVGPFKVTGLDIAVQRLKAAFDEASTQIPDVVAQVKTAGMLCVRHMRNDPNTFSNHSWGTAVDLYFGKGVIPQGTKKTYRGCLQLAPFFNNHGWYWGAGFSGSSVDSMHFELAKETIQAAAKAVS